MKTNPPVLVAILATLLLTSGCVVQQAGPIVTVAPTTATATALPAATSAPATATPVPLQPTVEATDTPATVNQRTVTLDDQGATLTLAVGERFLLALGEAYSWQVEVSDQSVVNRVPGITVVSGAQGVYEALQPGTATLNAAGNPLCRQLKPACAMPSIAFRVTLVVS